MHLPARQRFEIKTFAPKAWAAVRVRIITNPPIALKAPMRFKRDNLADYSLVELAVLRGLGISPAQGYDFRPTAPRQRLVPERVRIQQQMLEEESRQLGEAPSAQNF